MYTYYYNNYFLSRKLVTYIDYITNTLKEKEFIVSYYIK